MNIRQNWSESWNQRGVSRRLIVFRHPVANGIEERPMPYFIICR